MKKENKKTFEQNKQELKDLITKFPEIYKDLYMPKEVSIEEFFNCENEDNSKNEKDN